MKVTEGKAKFQPFTITVETEKEAKALYYALEHSDDESLDEHLEEMKVDSDEQMEIRDILLDLYSKYEESYTPNG